MSGAPSASQAKAWSTTKVASLPRSSSRKSRRLLRVLMQIYSPSRLSILILFQASLSRVTLVLVKWQRTESRSLRKWELTSKIGLSLLSTPSGASVLSSSGSSSRRTFLLTTPGHHGLKSLMTRPLCHLHAKKLKKLSTSSTSIWLKNPPPLTAPTPKSSFRLNVWSSTWAGTKRSTQAVKTVTRQSERLSCSFSETTLSTLVCSQKRSVFLPKSFSFTFTKRSSMRNSSTCSPKLSPEHFPISY